MKKIILVLLIGFISLTGYTQKGVGVEITIDSIDIHSITIYNKVYAHIYKTTLDYDSLKSNNDYVLTVYFKVWQSRLKWQEGKVGNTWVKASFVLNYPNGTNLKTFMQTYYKAEFAELFGVGTGNVKFYLD